MANRWISTVFKGVRRFIDGATGQPLVERSDVELRNLTVFDDADNNRTIITANADVGNATPDPTPNTIAKRNALGNCGFVGLTSSTLATSGAATLNSCSVTNTLVSGGAITTSAACTAQQFVTTAGVISSSTNQILLATSGGTQVLTISQSLLTATLLTDLTARAYKTSQPVTYQVFIDMLALSDGINWKWSTFWVHQNANSTAIQFPISNLITQGCQLEGATVMISPATSHVSLPTMPSLAIKRYNPATHTTTTILSSPDASASLVQYEQPHIIGISGATHIVDKTNSAGNNYFVEFTPETGGNAVAGTQIRYIVLTFQTGAGATVRPI